jgi:DMSO/TMAO reductase YedYZ molybdopterin-dependent catalytic subunit
MDVDSVRRRSVLAHGSGALAGLAILNSPLLAQAFPARAGEEVVPWADPPPENPVPDVVQNQLDWEALDSWITPNDRFFRIAHYGWPEIDAVSWRLRVGGSVQNPLTLSLDDIRARPRQEVVFTVECSGNHGFPFFTGGIGNALWGGTPLASVLEEAGVADDAVEVVFFGADTGEEVVHEVPITEHFARSMSLADAMNPANLLCYEMNGEALPAGNGHPLRLIAPGWYGIASVKWLERIELRPTRYMGHFMATDYVSLREEAVDGGTLWTRNSVGPALLKSVPAKVTRENGAYRIVGAAWGAPIDRVEVRIDDGEWQAAELDRSDAAEHAWTFWSLDWPDPAAGPHTITSRVIDTEGNIQPAMDDPRIANKHTYWESNGQVTREIVVG